MSKMRVYCTIGLLMAVGAAWAQVEMDWSQTFGGEGTDECYSLIQTADGGFALAGTTESFGSGSSDMWLVRTDADGDTLWTRTFGGEGNDGCASLINTADGGFALAGWTASFSIGAENYWLVRTDAEGDSLWSRSFDAGGLELCHSIIQTVDGGFLLAGWTYSIGGFDMLLVRTDADGDSLWSCKYGGEQFDLCTSAIQTNDGGFALAGWTNTFGGSPMWLLRTDADGDSLWSRTFEGGGLGGSGSLIQTVDRGFALVGITTYLGAGLGDMWLVRTDADGDSLWSHTFGGGRQDGCYSLIQNADGGFSLAGSTRSFGAGGSDMWLVRTDANGDSLWSLTFGGERDDLNWSLIQTADGGFALAGHTNSFGAGNSDFYLVKTTPDPVSVRDSDSHSPIFLILCPPYPNPFNAHLTLTYNLPAAGEVKVRVFDVMGRDVAPPLNPPRERGGIGTGVHIITLDASTWAAGVYIIGLEAGGEVVRRRVSLVR